MATITCKCTAVRITFPVSTELFHHPTRALRSHVIENIFTSLDAKAMELDVTTWPSCGAQPR